MGKTNGKRNKGKMKNPTEKIKEVENKIKTDKQIIHYISNKIWNWKTNDLEDLKDLIQEALNLKKLQILKEWEKDNKKNNERLKNILYKLNFIEQKIKGEK